MPAEKGIVGIRSESATRGSTATVVDIPPEAPRGHGVGRRLTVLGVVLVVVVLVSFPLGPFPVDPWTVIQILVGKATGTATGASGVEETIVMQVRLPRIIGAILVGAALASAGAGYQSMFRNPLVSPAILGVSAGAGFGASIGILTGLPWALTQLLAFVFGVLAALFAISIARLLGRNSTVVLVLAGIVVSTLFQAFISITQFVANPDTTLPAITFWLMGGLGRVRADDLLVPVVILIVCMLALYVMRWPVSVMAAGEEEASTLGINRRLTWVVVIAAATLMTATAVSLAGIVGWVGLVVPHLARFVIGPSFDRLLPAAALMGAGFLVLVDDIARSATSLELPLGVLTAVIGAPFFVLLLARARKQWL